RDGFHHDRHHPLRPHRRRLRRPARHHAGQRRDQRPRNLRHLAHGIPRSAPHDRAHSDDALSLRVCQFYHHGRRLLRVSHRPQCDARDILEPHHRGHPPQQFPARHRQGLLLRFPGRLHGLPPGHAKRLHRRRRRGGRHPRGCGRHFRHHCLGRHLCRSLQRAAYLNREMNADDTKAEIRNLTMAYGSYLVMRNVSARIKRGSVFVIMGESGAGKSTLLRTMVGLQPPQEGDVLYDGRSFWELDEDSRRVELRKFGVLFQSGALWSSMTVAENVELPLVEYTDWSPGDRRDVVRLKLALVGLEGFEAYYPSELSGGMRKRAGLARAMALDPEILFFDEPSSGLDPILSRNLDELMLELRDSLGATLIVVSHELASIFTI